MRSQKTQRGKRFKGYVFSGVLFIAVFSLTVSMLFIIGTSLESSKRETLTIKERYLAESAAVICQNMIIKELEAKQLTVFYEHSGEGISIIDSDSLYEGNPDMDFSVICQEAETLIYKDGKAVTCEIELLNKTSPELKLHILDQNYALAVMDEYSSGELMPLEYRITVLLPYAALETELVLSGIEFRQSDSPSDGVMNIKLLTGNISTEIVSFNYRSR